MRIRYGAVHFVDSEDHASEDHAAVVFAEAESEEEISAISNIHWDDKGVVGNFCLRHGSRILFILPLEDENSAKHWAESVASRIEQVVELEIPGWKLNPPDRKAISDEIDDLFRNSP